MIDHLRGVRIIDLTQNLAGPYCTQILADLGAEIVKIEPPKGDAARAWAPPYWGGESPLFLSTNRGKRSIQLDLKSQVGKEILWKLVEGADVFAQSFRPGVVEELGFDYESVWERYPGIVYVSVTAYGPTGPLRDLPGYDSLMQAYSGIMSVTGHDSSEPARVGASVVDFGTGMWSALGVLAALHKRTETGKGSHVTTALLDTAIGWVSYHLMGHLATGLVPGPMGSGFAMIAPYQMFPTSDGQLMIGAGNDASFYRLCAALNLPDLPGDPRFASNPSRVERKEELFTLLADVTSKHTTQGLWELLGTYSVPCAPIQNMAEVVSDRQVESSGMLPYVNHPDIPGYRDVALPIRWDGKRPETTLLPPKVGEHTWEILSELGYTGAEIDLLIAAGTVGVPGD